MSELVLPGDDGWGEARIAEDRVRDNVSDIVTRRVATDDLRIGRDRLKALAYATERESNGALLDEIAYSARVWTQVSLPYRDPGNISFWTRRNPSTGVELTVQPAIVDAPDGGKAQAFPYGVYPRLIMTWLATQATLTRDPEIAIGDSLAQFMSFLGIKKNGRDGKRLMDQMGRVFQAKMTIRGLFEDDEKVREIGGNFVVVDTWDLWTSKSSSTDAPVMWQSTVTLSEKFFRSIINGPVPVSMEAIKALGASPMRIDMYGWLTWRVFTMAARPEGERNKPVYVPWRSLSEQLGSNTTAREFKRSFIENLRDILIIWPGLNVEPTKDYLIIRPSRPHVLPKKRRNELI